MTALVKELQDGIAALEKAMATARLADTLDHAEHYCDAVLPAMATVREDRGQARRHRRRRPLAAADLPGDALHQVAFWLVPRDRASAVAGATASTAYACSVGTSKRARATSMVSQCSPCHRRAPGDAGDRCHLQGAARPCGILRTDEESEGVTYGRLRHFLVATYCPLIVNGEEGKAASGRQFARENPADVRRIATIAEQGTQGDARAAIDAARIAFDSNVGNWIYNYKLREQALFRTAQLIRENADRLARVVSLEVGMPMRQAVPHIAASADNFEFYAGLAGKLYGESFTLPSGSMINLVKEPVGVVGMITPWNFPLTQTARKVAPRSPPAARS